MIVSGKIYEFYPLTAADKALNVWGTAAGRHVNVNLYTADHSSTQRWRAVEQCPGVFVLHSMADERYVLDRYRGASAPQNANLYTEAATEADRRDQQLRFTVCGTADGREICTIALAADGRRLCIVDGGSGSKNGRTAASTGNVYFGSGSEQLQKWLVVPAEDEELTVGVRPCGLQYASASYTAPLNPFARGQCTWHAWGRAREAAGKTLTFDIAVGRHGGAWFDHVTNAAAKAAQPVKGRMAVASWSRGPYGHVAFVERFDGKYVWFTEANADGKGTVDAADGVVKKRTPGQMKYYAGRLNGYLIL